MLEVREATTSAFSSRITDSDLLIDDGARAAGVSGSCRASAQLHPQLVRGDSSTVVFISLAQSLLLLRCHRDLREHLRHRNMRASPMQTIPSAEESVYIFLDESGNLDFSPSGTRYFVLTCVSMTRPFPAYASLDALKYDLIQDGLDLDSFHAAEDNRAVRNAAFDCIGNSLTGIRVDSLIVEKSKTGPALTADLRFYPEMLGYLLKWVLPRLSPQGGDRIVITDTIPIKRQRKAVTKGVQQSLQQMLPGGIRYRIRHHPSRSHYGLQVADYCSWALFRKWERADESYYQKIRGSVASEFDIFRHGSTHYY